MARLEQLPTCVRLIVEAHDVVLEVGRQSREDPPPLAVVPFPNYTRLVIATREQNEIGRRQLRIEVLGVKRVRLTNINDNNQVSLPSGRELSPGESIDSLLPVLLNRGEFRLSIEPAETEPHRPPVAQDSFESLAMAPNSPNASQFLTVGTNRSFLSMSSGGESFVSSIRRSDTSMMLDRLGQLVTVMQQVASTANFANQIAQTVLDMVDLDRAVVLVREGDAWKMVAVADQLYAATPESWQPSQKLLGQILRDRRTVWGTPATINTNPTESITFVLAMVAAPILDADGHVIGAVYGDRRLGGDLERLPINQFDAKLVEVLACGVAGGWARVEQERIAAEKRVQFERFVTKEVAQSLEDDPDALVGRDADVTLLFCDIAGFSRISGLLTPRQTFDWINAVMETLSQCVLQTKGTLVDYVGDELIAMWGAPLATTDHAEAAAETAVLMLDALKSLNERYKLPENETTQVGIGLNSGIVRVGNTGSEHKLKYGPLGSHVNIASRVQGATRFLRTPALITGNTASRLSKRFRTRRLCSVRLKSIEQPVELFELASNPEPDWDQFAARYEDALKAWENGDLKTTIEILSQLVAKKSDDGPTMVLLSRAVDAWARDLHEFDSVWTLASK